MEMKDRVEAVLKIYREREGDEEDTHYELNRLKAWLEEYLSITKETELLEKLKKDWQDITFSKRLARWDEKLLQVISGDKEWAVDVDERGRPIKPAPYYPATTGTTLSLGGAGTGATWSNTATTATQQQLEELKKAFKEYKEGKE